MFVYPTRRFSLSRLRAIASRPFQYRAATSFPALHGQAGGSLLIHQFLPGPGFDGQDAEP